MVTSTASTNPSTKKSKVWLYFEEITEGTKKKTCCKIEGCNEKLSYNGDTSTMKNHLEGKHRDVWLQENDKEDNHNFIL